MDASSSIVSTPASLQDISDSYDVILCDVWGVLHNGLTAYPRAAEALISFRQKGGQVVLISNAPRPGASVVTQLDRLGVSRRAFDAILTSGDLTRAAVQERLPQMAHHLGPPRDHGIFTGLDVRLGSIAESDYVVCSGFDNDDLDTVEDYRDRLEALRKRNLWMVCANPDLVVERGHYLVPCAGALAEAYEALGGEVYYAGKPRRPIYEKAVALANRIAGKETTPPERILAIGDAIRTDVAGAVDFGVDSLLLARGIHVGDLLHDGETLAGSRAQEWLSYQAAKPKYVMEILF